jgi:pimeloyl-ACP methyl ester carboxylesterase
VFGQELQPQPLGLRPVDQWEDSGIGEAYGLDELAADVIAVADDVGADQLVLVGFSMSGKFAQYVSARYPTRPRTILVGGCPAGELPIPARAARELVLAGPATPSA